MLCPTCKSRGDSHNLALGEGAAAGFERHWCPRCGHSQDDAVVPVKKVAAPKKAVLSKESLDKAMDELEALDLGDGVKLVMAPTHAVEPPGEWVDRKEYGGNHQARMAKAAVASVDKVVQDELDPEVPRETVSKPKKAAKRSKRGGRK